MSKPKNINCPNCGESWSVLEVQEQECFECGYPNHDTDTEAVVKSTHPVQIIPHSGRGLTTFSAIQIEPKITQQAN